jgi:uncharacterized repeat protein (TIGR04138 family)
VDYPIDAVFFILSALYAVARRQLAAEPMGRHGDLHGGVRNVTAQELCRFIPEHAASMFGGATRASEVLSALGLRTSEDVGAIIRGYVDAGWLKPSPASGDDDYTGIDIGVASHRGLWSRFWPSYRRWRQPPYRPPATAMGKFRALLLMIGRGFCVGFGLSAVIVPGYVLWAERLTFEERPLVGRWYTMGEKKGEELKLIELRTDRLCEFQTLRLGQDTIPAGQSLSVRWAAREGRIVLTPPLRGYQDRAARAFGRGPIGLPGEIAFHTPDADTLEISRVGGPRVVYRRVPGGLASYAELFPPRQAGQ